MGYRDEEFYVPALFYADDGLLLARSCAEAESMIRVVVGVAGRCQLINNGKSSVMLYNYKGVPMERVGGDSVKYFGLDMSNSRKCFGACKRGRVALAEKMANMTFSVVYRSCNRFLIRKKYWKSVVQPMILNASSVIVWSSEEKKL